ncbi:GNAT family N-acetyltransferase [Portibacter lacus]|uniref:N-acetyltransferase n=1 Tax=Portibacter lacus TaxID=1099794 RepID=A0AA37SN84_9BACT|nr:GNAT family N-acetyltransferase [Portibacter lacus]GLR16534.1 N-acetyltransferase [Portibacter lacus]
MELKFANRFPVIKSERITLRELKKSDAEFIHFMRNDAKVNEFVDRPGTENIKDAEFFIEQRYQAFFHKEAIYWGIELNTNGFMIGSVTLWHLDLEEGQGELGYDLHPSFQRKGFMSEAIKTVLNYGFNMLQLKKIVAFTSTENKPSQKILEKFGFVRLPDKDMPEMDLEAGLYGYFLKA